MEVECEVGGNLHHDKLIDRRNLVINYLSRVARITPDTRNPEKSFKAQDSVSPGHCMSKQHPKQPQTLEMQISMICGEIKDMEHTA